MEQDPLVDEVLLALDSGDFTLTNWDIGFLESMLKRKAPLTEKQLGEVQVYARWERAGGGDGGKQP